MAAPFHFPKQKSFYKGKVRDVYNIDDQYLVMIVSDRISAFDVVLPRPIPYKGQVLNQIASRFLAATKDIVPNWVLEVPAAECHHRKSLRALPRGNGDSRLSGRFGMACL
jgi:phosphoribosylaminoimidazole-succinocarboxamide synthase